MSQEVELADGTILEFPDGTPASVMVDAGKRITLGGSTTPADPIGEIRAEPTFMEGVGSGLKSVAKEVLPLTGMVGGGLLGLPAGGPVGAAAGGIGGYVLGKQANDTIEALFNYLSGQPVRPASEIPGRFAQQVGEGATIEAGGAVLGRAGGKLAEILRDAGIPGFGAAPGMAGIQAAAQRAGVELPASAATGSRSLAAIESTPGRFPIGAQQAREFHDQIGLSMQRAGERLAQSAGPDVGLEAAGRGIQRDVSGLAQSQEQAARELIDQYVGQFGGGRELGPGALGVPNRTSLGAEVQAALDAAQTEARARIAPLYQGVREEVSAAGSAVPMTATKEAADQILALEQRMSTLGRPGVSRPAGAATELASGPIPAEVAALPATMQESIIRQLGLDQGRAIDPDIALELSKRLQAMARSAPDDITRRALTELRGAVEQDVTAWANVSGTNVGPLRQQAAQAYREQIVPYFTAQAPVRRSLMDVEPERAGQALLSARDPQLLRDALQFLPPETQNRLRAELLGGLPRDPAGFEAGVGRMGDDTLGALLGPEQVTRLGDLRRQLQSSFGPAGVEPQLAAIASKEGSVEGLVNSLTKGRYKSLEDFDAVWQSVSPETQQQVRSASLHRLVNEAFDPATGTFSAQRFLSRKAEVPDLVWQRMLGPDQRAAIDDLTAAFQQVTDYSRGAANPSGTGQAALAAGQMAALGHLAWSTLTGQQDPASFGAELAAITSPAWGGKLLFSRGAQNFLKRPGGQSTGLYAPLSRVLGIELTPGEPR